jgi:hypothetical protein
MTKTFTLTKRHARDIVKARPVTGRQSVVVDAAIKTCADKNKTTLLALSKV